MSVEQTTQLIQLILNSVLMSVVCALVLGGLVARHAGIDDRLQALNRQTSDGLENDSWRNNFASETLRERSSQTRRHLRQLQHRHRISHYSVLAAYYALLFSITSCFALSVRGAIDWSWLIPISLGLFAFGIAVLLVAIGLTLVDLHLSDRPLLDEARRLFNVGMTDSQVRSRQRSRRTGSHLRATSASESHEVRGTPSSLPPRQRTRFG
ncbi:MAG: DUF2721 domain-containing protein [Leptolyngbyaceae cyanobacterium RU_5_1]|nr:DUF2721 domain-containing protein [Leptolyngbyaceae cyanobacterium RU_5_1]